MGSTPESIRYVCQQLQCRPETVTWGRGREVVISRGVNNKLGFHFKTFQCSSGETITVVVKVKPDCHVTRGSLTTTDRILSICNVPVTGLSEGDIYQLLSRNQQPSIQLLVTAMNKLDPGAQVKRFLSINSGTSAGSGTASIDSAERPQVKRFAKSDSVEATSPPPLSGDLDPLALSPEPSHLPSESPAPAEAGGSLRGRQFAHLTSATQSLPATMEDEIILQDIVLCEAEATHSLPPVLSPHPISPPAPSLNTHRAASLTTTGIGGIGSVAEGGEAAVGPSMSNANSLGVEVCRATGCRLQNCLWHKFVLSNPQYVIWDPSTKAVVLEKNGSATFGFKYKVKKYDGPPAELYALVTEVSPGGPAWSQLLPADWIRSINGTAIDSAKEAFREFSSLSSLRLVLQRPDGLMPRAADKLKQMARSMRVPLFIPPRQSESSSASSTPSPSSQKPLSSPATRPGQVGSPTLGTLKGFVRRGSGKERESVETSGNILSSPVSVVPDPMLDQYPRQAQSPGEHIPLSTIVRTPQKTSFSSPEELLVCGVHTKCMLPRARVVMCGSHGSVAEFVHSLLADSGVMVDPDAHAQCFQLSMQISEDSGVQIHTWPQPLASLMEDMEPGSQGLNPNSARPQCLNLELYVIRDEDFFHHCAAWLLPSASMVILTFDVHKLMNQPEPETSRLAGMVHTVRTSRGAGSTSSNPAVVVYGVPSGTESNIAAEEVQAIFYVTCYGHQLLERYALNIPEVVQLSSMAGVRSSLFHSCLQRCEQTLVHPCAGRLLDTLTTCPDLHLSSAKLTAMLGKLDSNVNLDSLLSDLVAAGSLIPQGHMRSASEHGFFIPFNVFQSLSSLLIKSEVDSHSPASRQKWFKLLTLGRVSRAELGSILAADSPHHISLDLLESLGIIFRLPAPATARGDSGFAEESTDYVMPYFLFDHPPQDPDSRSQQFVLSFPGRLSWQSYFEMLSAMSMLPATEGLDRLGRHTCEVVHNGLSLTLHYRKNTDSIYISASRCDGKSREAVKVQQLERLFGYVVPPGVQFTLLPLESVDPNSGLLSGRDVATLTVHSRPAPSVPAAELDQETTLKTPSSLPGASALRQSSKPGVDALLTSLPWSALKNIAIRLSFETAVGPSWKDVAELAGKSNDEIFAYEAVATKELPALVFLKEYALSTNIQQLLDILEQLERPDVRDIIMEHIHR